MKKLCICFTLALLAVCSEVSLAQQTSIPRIISYQGVVKNTENLPVSGNHKVSIAFYSDTGATNMIWQGTYNILLDGGVFNVLLGSGSYPLPDAKAINRTLYVGVRLDGGTEMRPLSLMAASPYSLEVADSSITSEKIAADYVGSISVNGKKITGSGTALNLTSGIGTILTYNDTTNNLSINSLGGFGGGAKVQSIADTDWLVGGNTIASGTAILGTTATSTVQNWELHVGGNIAVQYFVADPPNIDGGKSTNEIINGVSLQPTIGAFIGGGGGYSSISGGTGLDHNKVSNAYGTVGGGTGNVAGGTEANNAFQTVGGGLGNWAKGDDAVVAGGEYGTASGDESVVSGGHTNSALGGASAVVGGYHNIAGNTPGTDSDPGVGLGAFVGGGAWLDDKTAEHDSVNNAANANNSSIVGGFRNVTNVGANNSAIGGGHNNVIADSNSAIAGGKFLTLGQSSFGFSGQTKTTQTDLSGQSQIAAFNDVDVLIGNVDTNARSLRFYEPNGSPTYSSANYTSMKAGAQTTNIPYTLPLSKGGKFAIMYLSDSTATNQQMAWLPPGAVGTFLKSTNTGLTWDTVSGGGGSFSLKWYDEDPVGPIAGDGPVGRGHAAIALGEHDQTLADNSIIGGGQNNLIDSFASHSVIAGGGYNTIPNKLNHKTLIGEDSIFVGDSNQYSFIGGGRFNRLKAPYGVIGGGDSNIIDTNVYWGAGYSVIGGGLGNKIDFESPYNTIAGGGYNYHSGSLSFIGGGSRDTVFDNSAWNGIASGYANFIGDIFHRRFGSGGLGINYSFIGGGDTNTVASSYSVIAGGMKNTIKASSNYSIIGAGDSNVIAAPWSTIGGGRFNSIGDSAGDSFIGSGYINTISYAADQATISGGQYNFIYHGASCSTIGGGVSNLVAGLNSVIAGGCTNVIDTSTIYTVIGGGCGNIAADSAVTISGGQHNTVLGFGGSIGGGILNLIDAFDTTYHAIDNESKYGAIGGGEQNAITKVPLSELGLHSYPLGYSMPAVASIGGGYEDTAAGSFSSIGGGFKNRAYGIASTVPGGYGLKAFDWQTVVGVFNSSRTKPLHNTGNSFSGVTLPSSDDPVFVVGNGTNDTTRSSAFEVTNDGRITAFKINKGGGAVPLADIPPARAVLGSVYRNNTIDAWANVQWLGTRDTVMSDFGVQLITRTGTGVYVVQLFVTDPVTESPTFNLQDASVVVTMMDYSTFESCAIPIVSPISGNSFTIKLLNPLDSCHFVDHSFTFHVTGR